MSKDELNEQPGLISAEEFARGWDVERRVHELNPATFTLRGTTMYVPARTKADMDDALSGPTQAVKTRTFTEDYRVWISPCGLEAPDARRLRPITDTQGAAEFGFAIPLRKLGLKVPYTRQYRFEARRLPVEGGGVVYEISFKGFENLRRDVDKATLAQAGATKADKAKARRSRRKREVTGTDGPQTQP